MSFLKLARDIWRDWSTDGIPATGAHLPSKLDIRTWGATIEAIVQTVGTQGGTIFPSRATMNAALAYAENTQAWVYGDVTPANNGVYRKIGLSGGGSWTRIADLPYSVIPLTVTGGTANAIQASSGLPVPTASRAAILLLTPTANNTAAVTLSINAAPPLPLVGQAAEAMASGYLQSGSGIAIVRIGSEYRTLNDFRIASLAAAAQASATAADVARVAAESAATAVNLRIYDTLVSATAGTVPAAAEYAMIAEFEPYALPFKRVGFDPGSVTKFQDASGAWFRGLALPPAIIDLANEVPRIASVTLAAGDMNKCHVFSMALGTTLNCTLPPANAHVGKTLHIVVDRTAGGLLNIKATAGQATSLIEDWGTDDFWMWSGEDVTIIATASGWRIRGGRSRPMQLTASRPSGVGNNIAVASGATVELTGFTTTFAGTFWRHGAHGLNGTGQIIAPRRSFYSINLDMAFTFAGAPTFAFAQIDGNTASRGILTSQGGVLKCHAHLESNFNTGSIIESQAFVTGGTTVVVDHVTYVPRVTITEQAQW